MNVAPVRLEGEMLVLEPLRAEHAPELFPLAEPGLFSHTLDWPADGSREAFDAWIERCLSAPASLDFVLRLRETGEPVGCSAYLEIRPAHRGLEIGRTWIARPWQGSRVNPESKYVLLRHAFETLGAVRVQFKTDLNNLHSQRAIEKLGARREGVLRRYQMRANGSFRDTVMYSITDGEWPEVRTGLEARLAR